MFDFLKREKKESPVNYTEGQYLGMSNASWMARSYENFADEGYMRNVITYRVISEIANMAASIGYKVMRDDVEVKDSRLNDILERPNLELDYCQFIENLISYYLISGDAYVVANSGVTTNPKELFLLRPDMMGVQRTKNGTLQAYVFAKDKANEKVFPVSKVDGKSPVMHMKAFHPLDPNYGMSAIEGCAYSVDIHNEISQFNKSLMQNKGQPSALIKLSGVNETALSRFKEFFKSNYSGTRNAGKPMVLEDGDFEYHQMSIDPDKLSYLESRKDMAREIAMAFNYPPVLLGFAEGSTFNNVHEAKLHLIDATIVPLVKKVISALNRWLVPMIDPNLRIVMDKDTIPGNDARRMIQMEQLTKVDFLTIEEKRRMAGFEDEPDGTLLIDSNKIPIDDAEAPTVDEKHFLFASMVLDEGIDPEEAKAILDEAIETKSLSEKERTPPEGAKNNAQKVLDWKEEHGDEVNGMSEVGWRRARQLASGGAVSEDVIKRMAQFNRHRENGNLDDDKKGKPWTDAGYVAWLGWGGTTGIDWAIQQSKKMEND